MKKGVKNKRTLKNRPKALSKKRPVKRKEKPGAPEDIIFDSNVGKTDALFVDNPEPAKPPQPALAGQKKNFWQKLFFFKLLKNN